MSVGFRVSKVSLCLQILKGHWPRSGIEVSGQLRIVGLLAREHCKGAIRLILAQLSESGGEELDREEESWIGPKNGFLKISHLDFHQVSLSSNPGIPRVRSMGPNVLFVIYFGFSWVCFAEGSKGLCCNQSFLDLVFCIIYNGEKRQTKRELIGMK